MTEIFDKFTLRHSRQNDGLPPTFIWEFKIGDGPFMPISDELAKQFLSLSGAQPPETDCAPMTDAPCRVSAETAETWRRLVLAEPQVGRAGRVMAAHIQALDSADIGRILEKNHQMIRSWHAPMPSDAAPVSDMCRKMAACASPPADANPADIVYVFSQNFGVGRPEGYTVEDCHSIRNFLGLPLVLPGPDPVPATGDILARAFERAGPRRD